MNGNLAPVVLFVYNRPDHTQKTLDALKKNHLAEHTELFIFSDAPKTEKQRHKVEEVREVIRQVSGFKSVSVVEAEANKGLANSVISGVTEIIHRYGKVIVLEDDILTSVCFLEFMNKALDFYQDDQSIWSLSGYKFPFEIPKTYKDSVFLSYRASSWGWATWADRWDTIDWTIRDYSSYVFNPLRICKFCRGGTDLDGMLRNQMKGKSDSWAVRWCYNQAMQDKYTIYPVKSLAASIGTDGSGTHFSNVTDRFFTEISDDFEYELPRNLKLDRNITARFKKVVNRSVIRKIKKIIAKLTSK